MSVADDAAAYYLPGMRGRAGTMPNGPTLDDLFKEGQSVGATAPEAGAQWALTARVDMMPVDKELEGCSSFSEDARGQQGTG